MNLRDYRIGGSATGQGRQNETETRAIGESRGGTTWFEPYRAPLQGVVNVNGEDVPVLIERPGDLPGASDVLSVIDGEGNIRTVKAEHCRVTAIPVTGGAYLPLQQALQAGRNITPFSRV